jgi:hypothetical protein
VVNASRNPLLTSERKMSCNSGSYHYHDDDDECGVLEVSRPQFSLDCCLVIIVGIFTVMPGVATLLFRTVVFKSLLMDR